MTLVFAIVNDAGEILRSASREEVLANQNLPARVRALVEQLPEKYPSCWFKEGDTFASIPIEPVDLEPFVELVNAYSDWAKPLQTSGMPDEAIARLNRQRIKDWCLEKAELNQCKSDLAPLYN